MTIRESGYTGPTSGRITVGGGGDNVTTERFYDEPLNAQERAAVEWFTDLSPHAQLRKVREMKWNLDVARKDAETWKEIAQREDRRADALVRELAAYAPDGFTLSVRAVELLDLAKEAGWETVVVWERDMEPGDDSTGVTVAVRHGLTVYRLRWDCTRGGGSRLTRAGLARTTERREWHDAPSLREITRTIRNNPSTENK